MYRRLTFDDPAGLLRLRIRLGVTLDDAHVLDDQLLAQHAQHFTLLALVGAGGNDYLVALANTVHSYRPRPLTALQARARHSSCTSRSSAPGSLSRKYVFRDRTND